jgi:hypothetical protein
MTQSTDRSKQDTVIFLKGIDPMLKAMFKGACASRGYSMKQVLVTFMREVVKAHEDPDDPENYDP